MGSIVIKNNQSSVGEIKQCVKLQPVILRQVKQIDYNTFYLVVITSTKEQQPCSRFWFRSGQLVMTGFWCLIDTKSHLL